MSFWDDIKKGFGDHLDKRAEERERLERIKREVELEKARVFEEEFKKNALEVATSEAKKKAASASGLQKLRASNRARNLGEKRITPGTTFSKLSEFTQRNIARREANLERTKSVRKDAADIRKERMQKRLNNRPQTQYKPWSNRTPSKRI